MEVFERFGKRKIELRERMEKLLINIYALISFIKMKIFESFKLNQEG